MAKIRQKRNIEKWLDHYAVIMFMTMITIYALFFDDLRIILFTKELDDLFYGITLFGMICFTLEISLASYSKEDYIMSFFFWLDIVSTVSMIPDCGWIWDPIIGAGSDDGSSQDAS